MTTQAPGADAPGSPDTAFLKLYAETRGFMLGRPTKPKVSPNGKTVLFLRSGPKAPKNSLFEFDVATGKTRELLAPEMLLKGADENLTPEEKARRERQRVSVGGFADYHLNPSGTHILVKLANSLFVFDRAANKATELKTGKDGAIVDPKWSPDGKLIGYVRGWDVYAYDLAAEKESAITAGGTQVKTHGLAEFVAQEEMGRHSGFWWSPDSKSIAYEEADHTGVEQWFVADPLKPEVPPAPQYYPRPGKKNVSVRLGVKKLAGGDTVWVKFESEYDYLCRVDWGAGGLVCQTQPRNQRQTHECLIDPANGELIVQFAEPLEGALPWQNLIPGLPISGDFGKKKGILKASDRHDETVWKPLYTVIGSGDHYLQLHLFDDKSIEGLPLARFDQFLSLDSDAKRAFVVSSNDPTRADVYEVTLTERIGATRLTTEPGLHTAVFSKDHALAVFTTTTLSQMAESRVEVPGGKRQGVLPSVAVEPSFKPNVTVAKVGDYWTAVVRPRNFDPKKKYPVIVDVYGGPKHLHVVQAMRNWLVPQWLADQGFIVVAIDNRGTPGRGAEWEKAIYKKFGTVPLEDQVKGLQALCDKCPELDRDRVGVVGWSFGGYMAANGVLRRPDVFKAAVAGAPVTDWEDYDTHYTERYMGLLPESKAAYDEASLIGLAKDLKRPLLLVHGTADDNVYYRHTLKLSDALFRAGRDFESLALPGITHMYSADPVVMERLWVKTAGYFKKHLGETK
jgi:dipeptidyl-peptidase-4